MSTAKNSYEPYPLHLQKVTRTSVTRSPWP